MATMRCPVGGETYEGQEFCLRHQEFLIPDVPLAPAGTCAEPGCDEPGCDEPLDAGACPVHALGSELPPVDEALVYGSPGATPERPVNATTRDRPRAATDVEYVLILPWGPWVVPWGDTSVGRALQDSELARRLERYDNVSRRHALLTWDDTGLTVTDLGSTNFTWVNERQLAPHQPCRLGHGDVVRFAARLSASVQERRR